MGEMKTTTFTLEDHKKRQHFALLLRPRNQVAGTAVVKPVLSMSKKKNSKTDGVKT
jgi:hypothetical protein